MQQTSTRPNQPATDSQLPARRWEDVAKEVIQEADSEKLSFLVEELCDILDKVSLGLR